MHIDIEFLYSIHKNLSLSLCRKDLRVCAMTSSQSIRVYVSSRPSPVHFCHSRSLSPLVHHHHEKGARARAEDTWSVTDRFSTLRPKIYQIEVPFKTKTKHDCGCPLHSCTTKETLLTLRTSLSACPLSNKATLILLLLETHQIINSNRKSR